MQRVAGRLGQGVISVFLLVSLVFFLIRLIPGDPAAMLAGPDSSPEQVEVIRQQLGLDRPVLTQYFSYLGDALHGDLGRSLRTRYTVFEVIAPRIPATLLLVSVGVSLAVIISFLAGTLAAAYRDSALDAFLTIIAVCLMSFPGFVLALIAVNVVSIWARLLPSGGYGTWQHLVLPASVLAATQIGLFMRVIRSAVVELLDADFIRTAHSKGVPPWGVLVCHALRNALVPAVTVIGIQAGLLIGGAVVTETVFNWPGICRLLVQAVLTRDYSVLQGLILLFGVCFIVINLLVDLINMGLDPRLRK